MPSLDFDNEWSLNQGASTKGQLVTAAALGGRVFDALPGWPGPAAGVTTWGTAALPLKWNRRDWATGQVLIPFVYVTPAAAANPTTSMQIDVIAADNIDLATSVALNGGAASAPVIVSTRTIPVASLVAGSYFSLPGLLPGSPRRYLGMKFTPIGGNATTGAWVAGLIDPNARPQENVTSI